MNIPEFLKESNYDSYEEYNNALMAFKISKIFNDDIEPYNGAYYAKNNNYRITSILETEYKNDYYTENYNHYILNVDAFINDLKFINQTWTNLLENDLSQYKWKLIKVFFKLQYMNIKYCDIVEVVAKQITVYNEV